MIGDPAESLAGAAGLPARRTPPGVDALACLRAGIDAVEPERLVREALLQEDLLREGLLRDPDADGAPRRISLLSFGKAAAAMARGAQSALDTLGIAVSDAVVVLPSGQDAPVPSAAQVFGAGHPEPTTGSVAGAEAARDLAAAAGEDDLLLVLVSGGGSALLTLPPSGVSLEDLSTATRRLQRAGAAIDELNCVRKHLDGLKGGRLARIAAPARTLGLVLSDVVGDLLDVIASGPLSPDPTTFADAYSIIERYGLEGDLPPSVLRHLRSGSENPASDESPKPGDAIFGRVDVRIVGNNRLAAEAVLGEAERRGYATTLLGTEVVGEARDVGRMLADLARRATGPAAILAAGETTVTVTGSGRGGRNQEVALGAALAWAGEPGGDQVLIASLGTDGIDGPTDAAGAVADVRTVVRGRAAGVDAAERLAANDAYTFFRALDDLVITGPTGTNVMDLTLVLVS